MSQGYFHDTRGMPDDDIRESIRVIRRERNVKFALVTLAAIVGICVLLLTAYLGFTPS